MFSFFKKKEQKREANFNYDSIVVDMHSHVLPGIDDGAQNPQESIFLIRKMMDLGIRKIIATPHIMADYYKNNAETIGNALTILKAELVKENIDIEVEAAAEHYFDETFEARIDDGKLMIMGDNYVLFELSFISQPPNILNIIQKMLDRGHRPILAHPERYAYMTIDQLANIRDYGCLLQLNTISLTGYYGKQVKMMAEALVDHQLIDFISSDMHHPKHAEALKNALSTPYVERLLHGYPLRNIMLK
ncbi:MAG TPA: CpsB/CapC family capsule biosynthesis tyrosine phosphatase [Mucilaginibacter sp.]|nr:CpsB/CapC family capsule biosynthesis tyrosine phosphatase [Mucilaginibacter sp.]